MKKFGGFAIWVWALVGLLGLSAAVLVAGKNETEAHPSVESYLPSGTRAFRDLLAESGYQVVVEREVKPKIRQGEIALVYTHLPPPAPTFGDEFSVPEEPEEPPIPPVEAALSKHLFYGGTVVELPYERDFIGDTRENQTPIQVRRPNSNRVYNGNFRTLPSTKSDMSGTNWVPIFANETHAATQVQLEGKGKRLLIGNGIASMNRFLGKEDNAEILMESISAVAPAGSTIRIIESELNPVSRGFFATIGNWALAAWYQCLVLAVVVAVTLGKRLGLPVKEQVRQRGTRELLDGIADTLARKKRANIALEYALSRNARRLRNHLRLPASVELPDLLRPLPDLLRSAFVQCEVLSKSDEVGEAEALKAIKRMESELKHFLNKRS